MDVRQPVPTISGDWVAQFGELWKSQVAQLQANFPTAIEDVRMPPAAATDVPIIFVRKESIVEVLEYVKHDPAFEYGFLADLTATDEESEFRFEIVYNLYSMSRHNRIRFKVRVRENEECPTLTSVWVAANWPEREVYDMFGVKFSGHPNLRRILMDERWVGYPLRKDYPLRGYQIFPTPQEIHPELLE